MRILNKIFTKNRFKTNIECVFKHSIVCSAYNCPFFSREFLGKERLPTGCHEESNTQKKALWDVNLALKITYRTSIWPSNIFD